MTTLSDHSLLEKLQPTFLFIRNIPYKVYFQGESNKQKIISALQGLGAGCSTKHELLGRFVESLGKSVQYVSYPFLWQELPVEFPAKISQLACHLGITYHLIPIARITEQEYRLDATWDSPLATLGFKINTLNDCLAHSLAVNPCGDAIKHCNLQERNDFIAKKWQNTSKKMADRQAEFYYQLNTWLKSVR